METFYYLIGQNADPLAWWQMCLRALIVSLFALTVFRLGPRRLFTRGAVLDIVMLVIIGSSLSRALTGNAPLLPTLAATLLLVLLHTLLAFIARHSEALSWLIKGRALQLVNDGEIIRANMKRAQMGERDLWQKLRLNGINDLEEVAEALLERNGEISVFKRRPGGREKTAGRGG